MHPTLILASDIHGSTAALRLLLQYAKHYQATVSLNLCDLMFKGALSCYRHYSGPGHCDSSYDFSAAGINLPLGTTTEVGGNTIGHDLIFPLLWFG